MADLADIHLRGTRAAQPAATTVAAGTLYFVTDESKTERASGTSGGFGVTWETYSSTATGAPGGSSTQVQYNNSGSFGGISGVTTNGTQIALGTPTSGALSNCDYPGKILAITQYNPGSMSDTTTTSTTGADVDAVNLVITFTAPASGNVLLTLSSRASESAGGYYWWNVRDGGGNVAGSRMLALGQAIDTHVTTMVKMTGLTPGNSYTWKWGFGVSTGTAHIYYGDPGGTTTPTAGPAVMMIQTAP